MTLRQTTLYALVVTSMLVATGQAARADVTSDLFARLDTDGDGVIRRPEFQIKSMEVFFVNDRSENIKLEPEETSLSAEAFAEADRDNDGALSGVEFLEAPFAKFEAADLNTDQKISRREFEQFVQQFIVD